MSPQAVKSDRLLACLLLTSLLVLAGCSASDPLSRPDSDRVRLYEVRQNSLSQVEEWAIEGRLAVNDGEDGGSGHLNWLWRDGFSRMDFYGALGRGAWKLTSDADGVLLELASGETYRADDVKQLAERQIGWEIPVDALAWWVLGLASPGEWETRELDEDGQLQTLGQYGWDHRIRRLQTDRQRFDATQDKRQAAIPRGQTGDQELAGRGPEQRWRVKAPQCAGRRRPS